MKKILTLSTLFAAAISFGAETVWYSNNTSSAAIEGAYWGDSANWNNPVEEGVGPTNTTDINAAVNLYNNIYIDTEVNINAVFFKPSTTAPDGATLVVKDGGTLNATGFTHDNAGADAGVLIESGGSVNLTQNASLPVNFSFAGGTLSGNNIDVAGTSRPGNFVFGAEDESGNFRAAVAHSFAVVNKIKIYSLADPRTTFRFNLDTPNLLIGGSASNLKDNAFIYSGNEIEIAANFSSLIDFSRIDFSALSGEYFVSFMAMERNYHEDKTIDFSYLDDFNGGVETAIEYGQEYNYGDNVSFVVSYDNANKIYSMVMNVAAIPEPSTYAALFGAIALAFVASRRRK